jgi:hypothetical protein
MAFDFDVTVTYDGDQAAAVAAARRVLIAQLTHLNTALGKEGESAFTEDDVNAATPIRLQAGLGVIFSHFFGQLDHATRITEAEAPAVVVRDAGQKNLIVGDEFDA